jgi:hypothetical protein
MTVTENQRVFFDAMLDTPFGAACVKKRGKKFEQLLDDRFGHGILVSPTITQDMLKGHPEGRLSNLLNAINQSIVVVRGHYHTEPGIEEKMAHFVWTGTTQEFDETWTVD